MPMHEPKMSWYRIEVYFRVAGEPREWEKEVEAVGSAFAVAEMLMRIAHLYPVACVDQVKAVPIKRSR